MKLDGMIELNKSKVRKKNEFQLNLEGAICISTFYLYFFLEIFFFFTLFIHIMSQCLKMGNILRKHGHLM